MDAHDDAELYALVDQARKLGFYVGVHRHYVASKGGGRFFVMRRKEYPEQKQPWLLRYVDADDVQFFLDQAAETNAA